jgi:radical SAM protein with 4Fe4S-binding SPASM domain
LLADAREIDRAWRPKYAVWEITLKCDLACTHCGSRAGKARPDELSTREALDVVRQLRDLGVREVTLIGGEAYLRDDWTEILRAIRDARMVPTMTTGGRGVTTGRAREAKDAGLRGVSVSIDGMRAIHDELRAAPGSYDAAILALARFREAGVAIGVNSQINRRNWRELRQLFEVVAAAGASAWQVQLTAAMGRAADDPDLLLEPHRMIDVVATLAVLAGEALDRGFGIRPGNNMGYFGPSEASLHGAHDRLPGGTCSAGRFTIGIEANGDVKACPSLPSSPYVGGNVRDHSIADIWERAEPLRFTRERKVEELWGRCRDCYYAEACMGGCSWTSHVLFGRTGNNPFCEHRALWLKSEGKRERLVRVEAAGGAPFDHARFEVVEEAWVDDVLEEGGA